MRSATTQQMTAWIIRVMTYLIVFVIASIIIKILWNGLPVINWEFLPRMPRRGGAEGGILPAIVGTLALSLGTVVVALPLGMATAIYLSEYAKAGRFTRTVRLGIWAPGGVCG